MRALMRVFLRAQVWLYRLTNGKVGGMGGTVVLLTTTGAKTGKERVVPLMGVRDEGRYLVAGSAGGGPRNPGWYYNVKADPAVTIEDRGRRMTATARIAEGPERDALYQKFIDMNKRFAGYETRTARTIPVVVIEPE